MDMLNHTDENLELNRLIILLDDFLSLYILKDLIALHVNEIHICQKMLQK
ncbi:hypothetical protein GCM10011282_08910 [Undibacterium macrobrachii]|uniref:Uncharacterized protein n=1 Tax=Undibacterium macrobrachii TaxID=1119058 RepID=A0ABQ2X8E8_9BURK|nr:hypothetical protein GCM10011282_08910 [Undibacterium macrobrachii]